MCSSSSHQVLRLFHVDSEKFILLSLLLPTLLQHSPSCRPKHTVITERTPSLPTPVSRLDDQTGVQPLNSACNLTLSSTRQWTPFKFEPLQSGLQSSRHSYSDQRSFVRLWLRFQPSLCVLAPGGSALLPGLRWKSYQIGSILFPGGRVLSYY